jgi:hypothetical protein
MLREQMGTEEQMRTPHVMVLFAIASCATTTSFYGEPKVKNGAAGCKTICSGYGMELTGMIALGEYSDGCICEVAGKHTPASASAAAGAAAAIMTSIDRQREASDAAAQPPLPPPPSPTP